MSKSWLYRFFKLGSIPLHYREIISQEGEVLVDEGLRGSITLKNYRAPGRYSSWRRQWFSGSIALTQQHFLCFTFGKTIIGVAWPDIQSKKLKLCVEHDHTICIEYDASMFSDSASGTIEVRYTTPQAQAILKEVQTRSTL